ncbi:ABC transporter permease [Anaerosphaera multitolerans]|uniref:Uncharacterized protein n=1 Tax=Anaerosphaera multitolerans TaxID=2487351 RepID=A0A437S958_9FIRM|nr:ABC transporter permease [Anaerosphaera multitolerans]RVU55441.1 hypothetical protein EF514_01550 [Anaerosphaera multitolerans]
MKAICSQMIVDLKLVIKNIFMWVMIGILLIIILVVRFLLPEQVRDSKAQIITYGMEGIGHLQIQTLDELEKVVRQEKNTVGIARVDEEYKIFTNGLSKKQVTAVVNSLLQEKDSLSEDVIVTYNSKITEQAPFNKRFVPIFICFEAAIIGLLMIGILILMEKSENTLKAYRVSPSSAMNYLISKVLLFTLMGTIYSVIMGFTTVGFHYNIFAFIILSLISSCIFSLIGVILAVFLDHLVIGL